MLYFKTQIKKKEEEDQREKKSGWKEKIEVELNLWVNSLCWELAQNLLPEQHGGGGKLFQGGREGTGITPESLIPGQFHRPSNWNDQITLKV